MSDVTSYYHQFRKDEGDQTRADSYTSSRSHRTPRSSTGSHHSVISSERPSSTFPAKPILPDEYPKKPQPQASSTRTNRDGNPEGNFGFRGQSSAYGSHSNPPPRPSERHQDSMQHSYDEHRYHNNNNNNNHPYYRSISPPSAADYDHPDRASYRSTSPPISDRPSAYSLAAYTGVDTVEAEAGNILISLANQHTAPLNVTSRPQSIEVEAATAIQSLSNPQTHQRYPPTPAQSTSSQSSSSKNSSMSIKNLLGDESSATSPVAPSPPPQRSNHQVEAQYREYQPNHIKANEKDRPFLNLTYSNASKQYVSSAQDPMVIDHRYGNMINTAGSKKMSKELMSQSTKISAKDARSAQKKSGKRKSLEASPQDHPSSKPKMIHSHSSPSMRPLAAPANISGPPSGGSAFHDAGHPYKGDDHRVMDYERSRSHNSRHMSSSDDQLRRIPVKTEDQAEGTISSWNNSVSDKRKEFEYRVHRDSSSPSHEHPSEQSKSMNIKVSNHPSSNNYPGPHNPPPWAGEQNVHGHGFDGYNQGKGLYDNATSPMSNSIRPEGHGTFNRKYNSMKQDPKLKRNATHAYITYMIFLDQMQKRAPQTITPSSSRESYTGPIGPPSHSAPSRSRSSSVPMPPQPGPNSASGAPYLPPYSGVREPREQYQYSSHTPSSVGYSGHAVYEEKRPLSAAAQRSPTSSSSRSQPVQPPYPQSVQTPYPNQQYPMAPAHHHSRNRTPQPSPGLTERSPIMAPHHPSMNPRRPSESEPLPRGHPGAQARPVTPTLPPLSAQPHHHHHHQPTAHHHHHHHYSDTQSQQPPNSHAHTHSAPPPSHQAHYSWPNPGSQAPYSPPALSQTALAPPPHPNYNSSSPSSKPAPNSRMPPSSLPPAQQTYPAQHSTSPNSLPPPSTLAGRDRDAPFTAGSSALPQPIEHSDHGNHGNTSTITNQPPLTQLLWNNNVGLNGGPRREETDRPPVSAGHSDVHLPPITSTVAPGPPVSSGAARGSFYTR